MHFALIVISFALVQIAASYLSGVLASGGHLSLQYLPLVALTALATFGAARYLTTVSRQPPRFWNLAGRYLTGLTLGAGLVVLIYSMKRDVTQTDVAWSVVVEIIRLVVSALSMLLAILVARHFEKRLAR